jgi:hypothetical protein
MSHGIGFVFPSRWPTRDEFRSHSLRMKGARAVADTLSPVKLGTPTILDQLDEGSCGGEAEVQAIHVELQARGLPSVILSPAFPYWCARREAVASDEDISDSGIDPFDMIAAIASFGACLEEDMPYDPRKRNEKPGAMAFSTAQKMRARMLPILEGGEDLWPALQYVMSVERLPVFIGIDVMPAFDHVGPDGIVDDPRGTSRGGHANLLYGWDERGALDANSWGTGWGVDGTCILTPRYLAERCHFAASVEVLT